METDALPGDAYGVAVERGAGWPALPQIGTYAIVNAHVAVDRAGLVSLPLYVPVLVAGEVVVVEVDPPVAHGVCGCYLHSVVSQGYAAAVHDVQHSAAWDAVAEGADDAPRRISCRVCGCRLRCCQPQDHGRACRECSEPSPSTLPHGIPPLSSLQR